MKKCDCYKGDCSNGEILFVISYDYIMFEEYDTDEDRSDGIEIHGVSVASASDEATAILKFKRHFTTNVDRFCPFEYVEFDIAEAKRIMVM